MSKDDTFDTDSDNAKFRKSILALRQVNGEHSIEIAKHNRVISSAFRRLLEHDYLLDQIIESERRQKLDDLHRDLFAYSVKNLRYRSLLVSQRFRRISDILDHSHFYEIFQQESKGLHAIDLGAFRHTIEHDEETSSEDMIEYLGISKQLDPEILNLGIGKIFELVYYLPQTFSLYEGELVSKKYVRYEVDKYSNPGPKEILHRIGAVIYGSAMIVGDISREDPLSVAAGALIIHDSSKKVWSSAAHKLFRKITQRTLDEFFRGDTN